MEDTVIGPLAGRWAVVRRRKEFNTMGRNAAYGGRSTRSGQGRAAGPMVAGAVALLLACWAATAQGQIEPRMAPSARFFDVFAPFYDGEYKDALRGFMDEVRGSIKTPQSRWIDSICYETMVGECYYEMGELGQALDRYTAAVRLYVAFNDWMIHVQFAPSIRPASPAAKTVPWGQSSRQSRLGFYPATTLMAQGRLNNNPIVRQGGVVQPPTLYPVNVQEIVRCTTLAIRRRMRLLGPTCGHDPLMQELAAALARRPGPPNHWSEAWINVQLGLAMIATGKEAQGENALKQSLVAAGEFDHPMTSIALLELGRLKLQSGDYPSAAKYFEEATYAAFHYTDGGVLEEAFRYGALTHMLANRPGVYPPLSAAAQWAKVKDARQLRVSLLLSAAENYAFLGQPREARALIEEARLAIGRREMARGRIGARLGHLAALVLFQEGKAADGDAALTAAMSFMRRGSLWLFHIGLADALCTSNAVSARVAMDMYRDVLRDPLPTDWQADPLESLAVLAVPHLLPYEHWFKVALERKEHEMAMEIADRTRRHRFFSELPFGGRLLSLRWVLEGPLEMLDQPAQLHRQDLLARYPAYAQLSRQARELRTALAAAPLVAPDNDAFKRQSQALAQLQAISLQQEAALREIAVRREPAGLVFPPLRSTQDIQKAIPPKHALLVFFATSRQQIYAFLLNNEQYSYWEVAAPAMIVRNLTGLLHDWGHFQQNHELSLKELGETKWKQTAAQLLEALLTGTKAEMKGAKPDFSKSFEELVIVPDGVLWHMPFESLQVPIDGQLRPLLSRVRMRYAPTASLAYAPLAAAKRTGHTAVVTGKLFPRDEPAVAQRGFEHLAAALPGAAALRGPLPGPSAVYSTLFDRLVVFDDLQTAGGGAFDWAPVPLERNKPNNALGDWLSLPWGGPAEVILPGFHTAAEDSLKSLNRAAPGHEMFLSVCGLMSCGARTILLSRWRTGGQTSYQLVREFAQELPHTTAADAWQRAVLVTAGTRLDLAGEPRIKGAATDEPPKANHPFFWAGYLLVDTGPAPTRPDEPAEEPVLKLKPPEPIGPPAPPGDNAPPPDVQPAPPDPKPDPKPQPPAERPKPGDKKPKPAKR